MSTCPAWCDDHMLTTDLSHHQSFERHAGGIGLLLVAPDVDASPADVDTLDDGGIYVIAPFGDALPLKPSTKAEAEERLQNLRRYVARCQEAVDGLERAIEEVWG